MGYYIELGNCIQMNNNQYLGFHTRKALETWVYRPLQDGKLYYTYMIQTEMLEAFSKLEVP